MRFFVEINAEWEVSPVGVAERRRRGEEFLLLDVRRPGEWETARVEGSVLVPLQELVERVGELEQWKGKPVVVMCHHGVRSMRGTAFLRQAGFGDVKSMAGGIEAWSVMVDAGVPRY